MNVLCRYPADDSNPWTKPTMERLAIANVKLFSKDPEDKKRVNTDKDRDFFMAMAFLTARRSEDPHRQVSIEDN